MRAARFADRVALGVMVLAAGALSVAVLISAVPSLSSAQGEDHLKCYLVKDSIKLKGKERDPKYWLGLDPNQLGLEEDCKIVAVSRYFCVPVAKQVTAPVVSKDITTPGSAWKDVFLSPISGPTEEDKLCYKIKCDDPIVPPTFDILDQFGERQVTTKKPFLLCGPAQKACADWAAPMCNGFCPPFEVCGVNPAGGCVCGPGGTGLPTFNVEHFNVYPATGIDVIPLGVDVVDQFFPFPGRPFEPGPPDQGWFMVPVAKSNDLDPVDPFTHLTCYPEAPLPGPDPDTVLVLNQFGEDQLLTITTTNSLCVPSVKEISPGPINDNHYHCYNAIGPPPVPPFPGALVNLRDQFQDFNMTPEEVVLFCAPATKFHGQVEFPNSNPDDHLTCYNYDPVGSVHPQGILFSNQFLLDQQIGLLDSHVLCVPSRKTWPVP
jgi:hypothetical protein